MAQASPLHLGIDGPGDNISGGVRPVLVVLQHEVAIRVPGQGEDAPHLCPAQGFGEQESPLIFFLGIGFVHDRGMKLEKLHVGDACPGPVRHGNAIAGGIVRIAGVPEHPAASAGGQKDRPGCEGLHPAAMPVEHVRAQTVIHRQSGPRDLVAGDQVERGVVFQHGYVGVLAHNLGQPLFHRLTSEITHAVYPGMLVAALLVQDVFPVPGRGKLHPGIDQELDGIGEGSPDKALDHGRGAQPVSSLERIPDMRLVPVLSPRGPLGFHRGNPTLGIVGAGLLQTRLGRQDDLSAPFAQLDRGSQAGDAAADDQELGADPFLVSLHLLCFRSAVLYIS